MSIWELRDYYKRMLDDTERLYVSLAEGPNKESAYAAVTYYSIMLGEYVRVTL